MLRPEPAVVQGTAQRPGALRPIPRSQRTIRRPCALHARGSSWS